MTVTVIFGDAAGHVLWRKTRSGFAGIVFSLVGTHAEAHETDVDVQGFVTGFPSDLGWKAARARRICPEFSVLSVYRPRAVQIRYVNH